MIEIIPAILESDPNEVRRKIGELKRCAPIIQLDVSDGEFAQGRTVRAENFSLKDFSGISFEVHLMVNRPEREMHAWSMLGAKRIIVHAEANPRASSIQDLTMRGQEVGIALTSASPFSKVEPYLHLVNFILFLTIDPPGIQGREFIQSSLSKIASFHSRYPLYPIEVDGGINEKTISAVIDAGATRIAVGSWLFSSANPIESAYTHILSLARKRAKGNKT